MLFSAWREVGLPLQRWDIERGLLKGRDGVFSKRACGDEMHSGCMEREWELELGAVMMASVGFNGVRRRFCGWVGIGLYS